MKIKRKGNPIAAHAWIMDALNECPWCGCQYELGDDPLPTILDDAQALEPGMDKGSVVCKVNAHYLTTRCPECDTIVKTAPPVYAESPDEEEA